GWRIVCIGSDYDGMIDPFDGYFSVSDLPTLFNDMTEYISITLLLILDTIQIFKLPEGNMK
ncbi:MAG: hypothetical protein Q8941_24195, partial [Bacteroidota bacterium]|nr:hypothetical protein [Bacteroidota bacterium]